MSPPAQRKLKASSGLVGPRAARLPAWHDSRPLAWSQVADHGECGARCAGARKAFYEDQERRHAMQTRRFTQTLGMTLAVMRMLKGRNDARSHTTPRAPRKQTIHIPYERRTNMQRVSLWMIAIGLFLSVGFLTVEPGYTEEKEHEPTCTLKTLKGRYLFSQPGTALPPFFPEITEP